MARLIAVIPLTVIYLLAVSSTSAALKGKYDSSWFLDANKMFKLHWTYDKANQELRFAMVANTTGWLGIGIANGVSGNMKGADIIMGFVTADGKGHLQDSYATAEETPRRDDSQDCTLTGFEESGGQTTIEFTRKLVTCDANDNQIKVGTTRVLYAFNDEDPTPGDPKSFKYHLTNRGAQSLLLLSKIPEAKPPKGEKSFDIMAKNIKLPARDTAYFCVLFTDLQKKLGGKKFVTKSTPIIEKGNEDIVHHITIWKCSPKFKDQLANFSGDCFASTTPSAVVECAGASLVWGWAIGGKALDMPPDVALPFAEHDEVYLMQMHYDNPTKAANRVDNSGFRFYYEDAPRKYEMGMFRLGLTFRRSILVPPQQDNWVINGYCKPGCIKGDNRTTPFGGKINILGAFLHQHYQGAGMWTKMVRDGTEILEVVRDDNYDFNMQQFQMFDKPIPFGPDDSFITACKFNTMKRRIATQGGFATSDEMCTNTMMYYPKQKFNQCTSKTLTLQSFSNKYAKPVNNTHNVGVNPYDWSNVTWTDGMIKELRGLYDTDQTTVQCTTFDGARTKEVKVWDTKKVSITKPLPPPKDPCTGIESSASPIRSSAFASLPLVMLVCLKAML